MTRISSSFAIVTILLVVFGGVSSRSAAQRWAKPKPGPAQTAEPEANSMTVWQARSIILERLPRVLSHQVRNMGNGIREDWDIRISAARVSGTKVEYDYSWSKTEHGFNYHPNPDSGAGTGTLDLKQIGPVWEVVSSGWAPYTKGRRPGTFTYSASAPFVCAGYCLIDRDQQSYVDSDFMWSSSEDATLLAQALNRLSESARGKQTPEEQAVWSDFPQKAAAWRALAVRPPLTDEVRKHRILAEKAISEQDMSGALEHYEAGLAIDPVWPEGHFNAAMLYAQLSFYNEAIQHMRAYLELLPDAPDGQPARDQIVIWEDELKKTSATK